MFVSKQLGRFLAAVCALVLSAGSLLAQNMTITGKVVDKNNEPIIGAYVVVAGTSTGTSTGVDGGYSITAPANGTLQFTCIGYKTLEVAIEGRRVVDAILADDALMLENAVVVGFGTQKKANLTGAVASIDASKQLESRPIPDIGRGLQGATPGLNVRIGSTEVGSDAIIRIRGQVGSYNGSAAPLILLDNVEIPSLNLINPDDIESISVLKDAASASIYGAKAAFGVILINSKKGAREKETVKVTYSGNVSFQNLVNTGGIADVDGLHYTVEAAERLGTFTPVGAFWLIDRAGYNAAVAWKEKYGKTVGPNDPMVYGRDWYVDASNRKIGVRTYNPYDYYVKKNAPTQTHNISVSGSKGRTNFNISLGYLDQSGMMKVTDYDWFKRYNANVRVDTQINDFVNVHAGMMYTNSTKSWAYATSSTTADVWYYLYRWGPTYPLVDKDEYGNNIRTGVYELKTANQATIKKSYASVNAGATITPVKNWNINVDYTYSNNNSQEHDPGIRYLAGNSWSSAVNVDGTTMANNEWYQYNGLPSSFVAKQLQLQDYTTSYDLIYQDSYTSTRQTWNVTTDYTLNIANAHELRFMLGLNSVDYKYTGVWGQRKDLLDINNPQFALATGTQTSGGDASWSSTLGFFGRLNYNYKERYLLEANLRYDGTSKFPTHLKWQWFPSFSAGWRVTEEPWMQGAKNVLSNLKFRASWGSIGDQSVASSLYIPTMSLITDYWQHSGVRDYAFSTPGLVASDISWQRIETLDFGVDLSLFNAFNITFDWYRRTTKDMIVGMEGLSYNIGASAPQGNFGQLHTDGWEFSVNYGHLFDNGLSLSVTAAIADAVTTIDEYGTAKSVSGWYNGKTYGEIWGYRVDRLFQNDDFKWENGALVAATDAYGRYYVYADGKDYATQGKITSGNLISGPGDVKFKDLNGDGVIDNGKLLIDDHGDLDIIGNTTPRYEYSFRVDAAWKGIDFSMFWQGIGKRDMLGSSWLTVPGFNITGDGGSAQCFVEDFWYETKDASGNVIEANYDAFYPRAASLGRSRSFNMTDNDRYMLNMAYLRLKNVTLGYTLPQKLTRKAFIDKLRFYVSLENFLTFDHLNGIPIDVEEVSGYSYLNSSNYNQSFAGIGAPAFKSASVGVQLTF
ncbi:MAG: SusC/RagA family TonB-linked outer membrane protein [Bacteroidales bacterium]|nr:SusC/RagA family TonB-linked outer membrane protein [Bacteroidales bacterium]